MERTGQCCIAVTGRLGGITTRMHGAFRSCTSSRHADHTSDDSACTAPAQRLHSAFTIPDTSTLPSGLAVAVVVSSALCEKKTIRLGRKPAANISTLPPNYVLMFVKTSATLSEQRSDLHPHFHRHDILCQQPATGPHRQSAIAATSPAVSVAVMLAKLALSSTRASWICSFVVRPAPALQNSFY